jgi:hypothetical protein
MASLILFASSFSGLQLTHRRKKRFFTAEEPYSYRSTRIDFDHRDVIVEVDIHTEFDCLGVELPNERRSYGGLLFHMLVSPGALGPPDKSPCHLLVLDET